MIDLPALAGLLAEHGDGLDHDVAPFRVGGVDHDTDARPVLMGVVNLSPDSWYRESVAASTQDAVRMGRVQRLEGADVVDVGAESVVTTAERVGAEQQRDRLVPVIEELVAAGVPTSVESYHPDVVEACLAAGASVLNLTGSVDDDVMFGLAADHGASVVLCHIAGDTARDLHAADDAALGGDPFPRLHEHFAGRLEHARRLGVRSLAVDPGVGFTTPWLATPADRARWQATALLHSFRLRELGVPVCHALPAAPGVFGEQVRTAEGFFAVLASLGRTGVVRTHEVPRVRAVLEALATFGTSYGAQAGPPTGRSGAAPG